MFDFARWGLLFVLPILVLFAGYLPDIDITLGGIIPQGAPHRGRALSYATLGFCVVGYLGLSWLLWLWFGYPPPWYHAAVWLGVYGWVGWGVSPYFTR